MAETYADTCFDVCYFHALCISEMPGHEAAYPCAREENRKTHQKYLDVWNNVFFNVREKPLTHFKSRQHKTQFGEKTATQMKVPHCFAVNGSFFSYW